MIAPDYHQFSGRFRPPRYRHVLRQKPRLPTRRAALAMAAPHSVQRVQAGAVTAEVNIAHSNVTTQAIAATTGNEPVFAKHTFLKREGPKLPARAKALANNTLDVDNGPSFLIHDHNARVYSSDALRTFWTRLAPGGVLVIWCEERSPDLLDALRALVTEDGPDAAASELIVPVEREGRRFDYALYRAERLSSRTPPAGR